VQLYAANIPLIIDACKQLEPLTATDDVERYLEIYEVAEADVHEAVSGAVVAELDDQESLRALRAVHLRFAILRRVFLCHLLSLQADGTAADAGPWREAVRAADGLAAACGDWAERVNAMVGTDERPAQQAVVPSTPTHAGSQRASPARERYRMQLRRANEIAAELRAMQAKLFVLRDDAGRLLEPGAAGSNLTVLPALFAAQAESLGHDLRQLNRSFDGWRAAIAGETRQRSSMGSSGGLRSPLSAVGEVGPFGLGTPAEALRALNGSTTDSGSSSGGGSPHASSTTDEEVFEAVAAPRALRRTTFTREEKMVRMQEDETRRALAKEKRLTSSNLMRELESVIGARAGSKRMSTGRIPPSSSRVASL
jgi:hypothetical protein